MAIVTTKAIVFNAIKYSDSSLIVKCFTFEDGLRSYLIRGILKSKKGKLKTAYFQPLSQLELVVNHKNNTTLNSIREARVYHPYNTIHTSIIKQTILLFLSEVLSSIIQEEEQNQSLYTYLETALIWFDTHDENANFHLVFLLNLTRFLGFYPDTSNSDDAVFNLMEGSFTNSTYDKLILKNEKLNLFKRVLGINFDTINQVFFSKKERQIVLRIIIHYFELHLEGFRKPKSLDILETVFR